jgi:hypothetical protein
VPGIVGAGMKVTGGLSICSATPDPLTMSRFAAEADATVRPKRATMTTRTRRISVHRRWWGPVG